MSACLALAGENRDSLPRWHKFSNDNSETENYMITQKEIKEMLSYNPNTGCFIWMVSRGSAKVGDAAGGINGKGYFQIRVKGKIYLSHRLAWMITHGKFPEYDTDHINHDRADNRIVNLREVTRQENMKNASLYKTNTSGCCGISWFKSDGKWMAYIKLNGKDAYLGLFTDKFEAICARKSAENTHGYHANHGRLNDKA